MVLPLPPSSPAPRSAAENLPDPLLGADDLDLELKRLAEEHQKLLAAMGIAQPTRPAPAVKPAPRPAAAPARRSAPSAADSAAVEKMRQENSRLATRLAELEHLLQAADAAPQPEANWDERQQEYEMMLAEKSEMIRELRAELQEFKDRPQMVSPKEEELVRLSEQLEEDRRLIQEDEAALEEQTKQMEMNIARQRAEIARQRTEVERMYADLQLEIDRFMREGDLRERLTPLQRRSEEFAVRAGLSPS